MRDLATISPAPSTATAFGDEHVLPEVADAARAPALVRERDQLVADPVGVEPFFGVPRERDLRIAERSDLRHCDRFAVPKRAQAAPRPPPHSQCGRAHDT